MKPSSSSMSAASPKATPDTSWPLVGICQHAKDQCRERAGLDPYAVQRRIETIVREGEGYVPPAGPAIRLGIEVVGIEYANPQAPQSGMIVTTYYQIDNPVAIRWYRKNAMGQSLQKPGRTQAWSRLRRQGTRCRRPPTFPRD